jgi:DNA-directed RNA polymerase subunit RPC12/RpoP
MKKDEILKPIPIKDLGVLYPTEYSKWKRSYNLYKCGFCGNEFKAQVRYINSGAIISCGCYNKQLVKDRNTKHGLVNTGLYGIWRNIKNRTLNPKHKQYNDYGGRGITICDEWKNDFMSFYAWAMTNGYSDELSIDRIDNDGGYSPENCRWTTSIIQNRNKRIPTNNTSGYKGVSYNKRRGKYQVQICVNKKSIYLGSFPTAVEGAIAYNNYIIENNLEGFILNEIEIE